MKLIQIQYCQRIFAVLTAMRGALTLRAEKYIDNLFFKI
jgi:hypothetical protein